MYIEDIHRYEHHYILYFYKEGVTMKLDLNAVGETALLTLYARAKDYESDQSVLKDQKSWDIFKAYWLWFWSI